MTDLARSVKEVVGAHINYDPEELSAEMSLTALGADSLDTVEIVMSLEDRFNIEIPDEKMDDIATVGDLIDAVRRLTFKN